MGIIREVARDRRGATVVEYGLICALIVLAIMVSLEMFSTAAVRMLYNVSDNVSVATS